IRSLRPPTAWSASSARAATTSRSASTPGKRLSLRSNRNPTRKNPGCAPQPGFFAVSGEEIMLVFENCEIDLENTFHCGQTFRWKRRGDGSFAGNVLGRAVRAQVRDGALCLLGAAEEDAPFWRAYFDLDSDYAALLAPVMDDHLRGAL